MPYNKNKLQFISDKYTYLGVSPTHKGHKCINLESRIFISKYVIFNERVSLQKKCYLKEDGSSHTQPRQSPKSSNLMLFLPESNFTPHLGQVTPTYVSPTIQTHNDVADTSTLPIDHNALPDVQNQHLKSY